jgi:hypothetical protein
LLLLLLLLLLMPLLFSFCHCYCHPRCCLQLTTPYDLFHVGRQVIGTCDGIRMLEERRRRLVYPLRHRQKHPGHECCGLPIRCHFRFSVGAVPVACVRLARPRARVGTFVRVACVCSVRPHAVRPSVGADHHWGVCPSVGAILVRVAHVQSARLQVRTDAAARAVCLQLARFRCDVVL